jgi:polysaccharide pyruvyl transferase WcaK-like protein
MLLTDCLQRQPSMVKPREPRKKHATKKHMRISVFGNFGLGNLGNESTFQAVLYNLRRLVPDAEVSCICPAPEVVAAAYNISAVPITGIVVRPWTFRNSVARLVRKLFIGIPSELYRWLRCFVTLRRADVLFVAGTGLLSDAYGLTRNDGPYSVFKWSVAAKLSGCKLLFVSVGVGPLYGRLGRFFVKAALSLADFRSYRDAASRQYLERIGFQRKNDRVSPDLVFSLPDAVIPHHAITDRKRTVVGVGVMEYAGRYSVDQPSTATYQCYLDCLVKFVTWLLAHDYNVRLLVGDTCDEAVAQQLSCLLKGRLDYDPARIIHEPAHSVAELLSQLAATDLIVATRFHNVLLSLLLNKPAISISFHPKCTSLMSQMGLSQYCQDINHLHSDRLIEGFRELERNSEQVKAQIKIRVAEFRARLDEQYAVIFGKHDDAEAISRQIYNQCPATGRD